MPLGSQRISIETTGVARIAQKLQALGSTGLAEATRGMLDAIGTAMVEAVRAGTPVRSGALRDAWERIEDPSGQFLTVANMLPYAHFIEDGWRDDPRSGRVYRRAGPARMLAMGAARASSAIAAAVANAQRAISAMWEE